MSSVQVVSRIIIASGDFHNFVIVDIYVINVSQVFELFQRQHLVLHVCRNVVGDGLRLDWKLVRPLICKFNWTWTSQIG